MPVVGVGRSDLIFLSCFLSPSPASTFRPLKPEKAKARRRHRRTTVMGIPHHVQRELGTLLIIYALSGLKCVNIGKSEDACG